VQVTDRVRRSKQCRHREAPINYLRVGVDALELATNRLSITSRVA
jgi:hypothetical protein